MILTQSRPPCWETGTIGKGSHLHQFSIGPEVSAHVFWSCLAREGLRWLDEQQIDARDTIVLLPFAQHLAPARRAWLPLARWQPRLETTHSLASALRPSPLPQAWQISMDAAIDALSADRLLQGQSWAQALKRSDARAYALALQHLVETAQALLRRSHACAPSARDDYWSAAREALQGQGTGELERALALVALEWAAADDRLPATDALFDLRPSAWLYLQAGGADPLAHAVLQHAQALGVPCAVIQADFELETPALPARCAAQPEVAVCQDFEDLAQATAAAVIGHLNQGRTPVALAALDRVLVRRVRALLDEAGVGLSDETGWTLATAPEAAAMMDLLRAATPRAAMDEFLSLLKSVMCQRLRSMVGDEALAALESRCRRDRVREVAEMPESRLDTAAARLWGLCRYALAPLREAPSRQPLADWLAQLAEVVRRLGIQDVLEQSAAGAQMLDALWLRRQPWPDSAHEVAVRNASLTQPEFVRWVSATLEAAQFMPAAALQAQLVITPLARTMLRPFAAVVVPGVDAQTLGPVPPAPVLLGEPLAARLGLPAMDDKRAAMGAAFAQLLRAPALTLLRSRAKGSEPLAPSPLLERLAMAWSGDGGAGLQCWVDAREPDPIEQTPRHRPGVSLPSMRPVSLSASAIESLRNCPYQFFARCLLGLGEAPELEAELEKRDYGNWLHAVLNRFHETRRDASSESTDEALLWKLAEQERERMGIKAAEFLPYQAAFGPFITKYLKWLSAREQAGALYHAGEQRREMQPFAAMSPALAPIRLHGRIDRIDAVASEAGSEAAAWQLIDYKTGNAKDLQAKAEEGPEDTQLAVYAVLAAQDGRPVEAMYLALDDKDALVEVVHPDVQHSAAVLTEGLAADLLAMQQGQPLPALGEGRACSFCDVRGLCRRDDWRDA